MYYVVSSSVVFSTAGVISMYVCNNRTAQVDRIYPIALRPSLETPSLGNFNVDERISRIELN